MKAVLAALALGLLLWAGCTTFVDPDIWHLLTLVRAAWALGAIPTDDLFAYTPTVTPVVHHEWGTGTIVYLVAHAWGLAGLQVLRLLLVAIAVGATVRTAYARGATTAALVLLSPPAIVMSWIGLTLVRPQLFTIAGVALLLAALDRDRRGRPLPAVPWAIGFVIWANLHGGFVVGLVFVAAHTLEQLLGGRPMRHLLALLALATAGILINPYGASYYGYLAQALTMARPLIVEWRPLWQAPAPAIATVAVALALAAYALRATPGSIPGWTMLVLAAYAAVRHERHVAILAVVWVAYVPAAVSATALGRRLERLYARPIAWGLIGALLLAGVTTVALSRPWAVSVPGTPTHRVVYPVGAATYLADAGVTANVMTPFTAGAYLTWKLHPRIKVSMDGRFEAAYPPALLAQHLDFYHGAPDWRSIRDAYPSDLILTRRTWAAARLLREEATWPVVYEDDAFVLFARPELDLPRRDWRGRVLAGTFP